MSDLIDCVDLAEFEALHGLIRKVLPCDYPRTVGEQPSEHFGSGRHVVVEIIGHVAPEVEEGTGQVRLRVTGQLIAAVATEQAADLQDRRLEPQELGQLISALASANPE